MRRQPIYLLVDVSDSMNGEPIKKVQDAICKITRDLRNDPYALEYVHIGVITFADTAKIISPLTEIVYTKPTYFTIGGTSVFSSALETLLCDINKSVVKTTAEHKGDRTPIVFLFSNISDANDIVSAIKEWGSECEKGCHLMTILVDAKNEIDELKTMSDDIISIQHIDKVSFSSILSIVGRTITYNFKYKFQ